MNNEKLESLFPNLLNGKYKITSPESIKYNCIAWAAGDNQNWWEPFYYNWPGGATFDISIGSIISAFKILGYEPCDNSNFENNYEKVAIYVEYGEFTHLARQLDSGNWTSKLGTLEDIEHQTLKALEDSDYGKVAVILKRPK